MSRVLPYNQAYVFQMYLGTRSFPGIERGGLDLIASGKFNFSPTIATYKTLHNYVRLPYYMYMYTIASCQGSLLEPNPFSLYKATTSPLELMHTTIAL